MAGNGKIERQRRCLFETGVETDAAVSAGWLSEYSGGRYCDVWIASGGSRILGGIGGECPGWRNLQFCDESELDVSFQRSCGKTGCLVLYGAAGLLCDGIWAGTSVYRMVAAGPDEKLAGTYQYGVWHAVVCPVELWAAKKFCIWQEKGRWRLMKKICL